MSQMNWWSSNTSLTDASTTWYSTDNTSNFQTYKITYYDPMEYKAGAVAPDAQVPDPSPKVKKTTVDPLDWLNDRVAEITELVEI